MPSSSSSTSSGLLDRMKASLEAREARGTLRKLPSPDVGPSSSISLVDDFSSNDYLGFAHRNLTEGGATGSRLLSGDGPHFHRLEARLARIHGVPYSLLCNSGYDANLSVVSSLAADVILYDSYIHNSLHMGMRLWKSHGENRSAQPFEHNSVADLRSKLQAQHKTGLIAILIESVYSMDGDVAPVSDILNEAQAYGAHVVVDEAHGWGVLGDKGLGALEGQTGHPALAFGIYTFGKAAGTHGALVCCPSRVARDYLVNYAYPFIYSTALPEHSVRCIEKAYDTLLSYEGSKVREHVRAMIDRFRTAMESILFRQRSYPRQLRLLPSITPIQALIVPGNAACTSFCERIFQNSGIRLFPIKSPTIPAGQERVRIVLHSHNTINQVDGLIRNLQQAIENNYGNQSRL